MNASAWIFAIVIVAVVAVIVTVTVKANRARAARNASDAVIATLELGAESLRLTETELIEGYADDALRHPIAGLVARVEDSGTVNRRITATRMLALGPFSLAAPKKLDDRELYLTIEGPTTGILRMVQVKNNPSIGTSARQFAMKVSAQGRLAEVAPPVITD